MKICNIYYSRSNNQYFSDSLEVCCDSCKNKAPAMFLFNFWRKKNFSNKLLCHSCLKKSTDEFGIVKEHKLILFTDMIPDDSVSVFIRPPQIVDGFDNKNCYDLADKQIEGEKTIDKTKHCHNPNFMRDPKYIPFDQKSLEYKDQPIGINEAFNLLKNLQQMNRDSILEDKRTKRVEYGKM